MKKRGWRNKKAQINLSFGMIFSIILIIIFLAFAFYAIGKFLDIQKAAKTAQFVDAFKSDVEKMWRSSSGSQEIQYSLPTSVKKVCFADFSTGANAKPLSQKNIYDDLKLIYFKDENLFFYPVGSAESVDSVRIDNIDIYEITKNENPYCVNSINGKIKFTIKKGLSEALVVVTR